MQGPHQRPLGELDLERGAGYGERVAHGGLCGSAEVLPLAGASRSICSAAKARHGIVPTPPRPIRACADHPVLQHHGDRCRGERELIGGAVADLEIGRPRDRRQQRDLDLGDQLTVRQHVLDVGGIPWLEVELG